MNDPELDLLVRYLVACQRAVREHDQSGRMPKQKELFLKLVVRDLCYAGHGVAQVNFDCEQIVRETWHWRDYGEFRKSVFPCLPEHRACVDSFHQTYGLPPGDIERLLDLLTHRLAPKMVEPIEQTTLRDEAVVLLNDLRLRQVTWNAYLWLQGIILEVERIELGESLVIRRPIPADFERELSVGRAHSGELYPDPGTFPSAVVEYQFERGTSADQFASWNAEHAVEALIQALRLYRVGSVEVVRYEYRPVSVRCHGGTIVCDRPRIYYQYSLGFQDSADLTKFLRSLIDRIPSYMEMLDPPKRPNILGIPLPRYTDCLRREMGVEERMASAVTCLEGLFMRDDETAELTFRLAQRVAIMLRSLGLGAKQVFDDVKAAYKIRSKFVHGAFIKDKHRKENFELAGRIVNYARISLIVSFQLGLTGPETKAGFLEAVDNSMLDDDDARSLKEKISSQTYVPHVATTPISYPPT